MRFMVLFVQ